MLFFIFVLFHIGMCLWVCYPLSTEIKFSLMRNSTVRETDSCLEQNGNVKSGLSLYLKNKNFIKHKIQV